MVCARREARKVRITLLKGPPLCHFAFCAQLVPTCLILHKVALNPLQTPQLIWHPNAVPWTMPAPSTSGNVVTQQRGKMLK